MSNEYDSINLFLETYNYNAGFENEESTGTAEKVIKKNRLVQDGKMTKKNL